MDGIIFDVDGTLWDSTPQVAESWNEAIRENSDIQMDITPELLKTLFGRPMNIIMEKLFPELPAEEQVRLGDICMDYENRYLETHPGTMFDGVYETFEQLSLNYPIYIVSNCQCGYIEICIKTTELDAFVKDHLCFGETNAPKSETIRLLMERNSLKDVIYVGDTIGDYNACKAADVPFIFAEYGFGEAPDAELRIKSMNELPELVKTLI